MVLPAFYLFYLLAAKYGWKKKLISLIAATAVVAVVSISWAVVVDSVPASERPFIGSSGTNSVLNLAFGYNGVSRLTGERSTGAAGGSGQGFGGGMPSFGGQASNNDGANGQTPSDGGGRGNFGGFGGEDGMPGGQGGGFGGTNGGGAPGGNGDGMFNTGEAGPLRLFQSELSGQASWLIPLGLIGAFAILASWRRRNFTDKHKAIIFWLAWLVPVAGFFSIAGFFHQYYLIMLAPPVSALAGAAITEMWDAYRNREGWSSWLLPVSVLATAAFSWFILHPYDDTIGSFWSIGVLVIGIAAAVGLAVFKRGNHIRLQHASLIAALAALFIGPIYWSFTPIAYGQNSQLPAAGPDGSSSAFGGGGFGGMQDSESANQELLAYLREHNTGEQYLMAVTNYTTAAPYMIDEGESLVILNGFNASDEVYTPETLEALVRSGKVKYFLLGGGMGGGGREGNSEVTDWITENGTEIPSSEWQSTPEADTDTSAADTQNAFGFNDNLTLYEVTLPES